MRHLPHIAVFGFILTIIFGQFNAFGQLDANPEKCNLSEAALNAYGKRVSPSPYHMLSDCFNDPSCTDFLIVGHRGTYLYAPENTLAAFDRAIELGVDVIELDVRNTVDGYLIVIHDDTVNRTTNGRGAVEEMTLEEIQALTIPSHHPCIPPQKVPTFAEALSFLKGRIPIEVDVKTDLLEEIVAEVEQMEMFDQVYALAKSVDKGHRLVAANPNMKFQARAGSEEEVYLYLQELSPISVQVDLPFLTPDLIQAIHDAGAKVFVDATGTMDLLGQIGYKILQARGTQIMETDRIPLAVHYANTHTHQAKD